MPNWACQVEMPNRHAKLKMPTRNANVNTPNLDDNLKMRASCTCAFEMSIRNAKLNTHLKHNCKGVTFCLGSRWDNTLSFPLLDNLAFTINFCFCSAFTFTRHFLLLASNQQVWKGRGRVASNQQLWIIPARPQPESHMFRWALIVTRSSKLHSILSIPTHSKLFSAFWAF